MSARRLSPRDRRRILELPSSATPAEFHVENFRRLASRLEGTADEVVISAESDGPPERRKALPLFKE